MGPVGLVDPWVWWGCWSGGPWAWWDRGSGGPVGLVGPWVWWARGSGGPVGLGGFVGCSLIKVQLEGAWYAKVSLV